MCDCLKIVGEKIEARLLEKVPEGAEVSRGFDTGWDNTVFSLFSGRSLVNLRYKLAYKAKKKNGEMSKNHSRLDCSVAMAYCPFCGEEVAKP